MGDFTPHPFAPPSFHQDNENWGKVRPNWFPDEEALNCFSCNATFNTFKRRHHCRLCGGVFCGSCCNSKAIVVVLYDGAQRVCTQCFLRIRERSSAALNNNNNTNNNFSPTLDKRISRAIINSQDNIQVNDERKKCFINELPENLIIKIFSFLGEKEIFQLPLVCRTFHRIMDLNFLWRDWYCFKWNVQRGITQHIGINWKLVYKEKYIKEKENKMIHETEREERNHLSSDPNLSKKTQPKIVKPLPLRSCLTKEGAKIVLLGAEGVGKSTLVSYLCTEKYLDHNTTIGANYASKSIMVGENLVKLCIWDTAGLEKYWTLAPMYYMDSHVALLVYDLSNLESFEVVKKWMRELRAMGPSNLLICLVGNKVDLDYQRQVEQSVVSNFIQEEEIMMAIETSSKTGENIAKLFEEIAKSLFLSSNLPN